MGRIRSSGAAVAIGTSMLLLTGCGTLPPNDLVQIDVPGAQRYALSTEDGIVALNGPDLAVDEVPILYWFRGSTILDNATVQHRVADLGLLRPMSTRLEIAEFAAQSARAEDNLFVQILEADPGRQPTLVNVSLYQEGRYGDLLQIDDWSVDVSDLVSEYAGAGVYALRMGRYVLVGILNGTLASRPQGLGVSQSVFDTSSRDLVPFIGLDGIAPVLPDTSNFFKRRIQVRRPDFEYGLERDGQEPPPVK